MPHRDLGNRQRSTQLGHRDGKAKRGSEGGIQSCQGFRIAFADSPAHGLLVDGLHMASKEDSGLSEAIARRWIDAKS